MTAPAGVRLVLRGDGAFLGTRSPGAKGFDLPGGVADGVAPKKAAETLLRKTTGLTALSLTPAGRHALKPPECFSSGRGDMLVHHAFAYSVEEWEGRESAPRGAELSWVGPGELLLGQDGLVARSVLNKLGVIKRPELDLDDLYRRTSAAYGSDDAGGRMAGVTQAVDLVIDEVSFLIDIGKLHEIDRLLAAADVARLHADILDAFLSATEMTDGLMSLPRFREDAEYVIAEVGARIPKRRLVVDGAVVSEDVRADARRIYRAKAKEFGDELRERGNLDRHYDSRRAKAPETEVGQAATLERDGGGFRLRRH